MYHSEAYGIKFTEQNKLVDSMDKLIMTMRVNSKGALIICHKETLMINCSQRALFYEHSTPLDTSYLIICISNKNVLENCLSFIRSIGRFNDRPKPLD